MATLASQQNQISAKFEAHTEALTTKLLLERESRLREIDRETRGCRGLRRPLKELGMDTEKGERVEEDELAEKSLGFEERRAAEVAEQAILVQISVTLSFTLPALWSEYSKHKVKSEVENSWMSR